MFFCHIVDDFSLQGKFSFLKQKSWWVKACNDDGLNYEKYKSDYRMALFDYARPELGKSSMLPVWLLKLAWR